MKFKVNVTEESYEMLKQEHAKRPGGQSFEEYCNDLMVGNIGWCLKTLENSLHFNVMSGAEFEYLQSTRAGGAHNSLTVELGTINLPDSWVKRFGEYEKLLTGTEYGGRLIPYYLAVILCRTMPLCLKTGEPYANAFEQHESNVLSYGKAWFFPADCIGDEQLKLVPKARLDELKLFIKSGRFDLLSGWTVKAENLNNPLLEDVAISATGELNNVDNEPTRKWLYAILDTEDISRDSTTTDILNRVFRKLEKQIIWSGRGPHYLGFGKRFKIWLAGL